MMATIPFMAKKKILTVNNRTLLREYAKLRDKLVYGEIDRIIIPVNGKKLYMAVLPEKKPVPGDTRALLERLEKLGPKKRVEPVLLEWRMKSLE